MFAFRGTNEVTLDEKGRLVIPARYREVLLASEGGVLVATLSLQRTLWLFPLVVWKRVDQKLAALSDFEEGPRLVKKVLRGMATDCRCDRGGRVLLPGVLRKEAGLEREVCLMGGSDRFEVLARERWQGMLQRLQTLESEGKLAETLGELAL